MNRVVLDGSKLADAGAVYRALAEAFRFPAYFGHNPDALWDALGDYSGEPVIIVWHGADCSAKQFGPEFDAIVRVLQRAATLGILKFQRA